MKKDDIKNYLVSSCFIVFNKRCMELHNSEYEVNSPAIADQIISVKSTSLLTSPKVKMDLRISFCRRKINPLHFRFHNKNFIGYLIHWFRLRFHQNYSLIPEELWDLIYRIDITILCTLQDFIQINHENNQNRWVQFD